MARKLLKIERVTFRDINEPTESIEVIYSYGVEGFDEVSITDSLVINRSDHPGTNNVSAVANLVRQQIKAKHQIPD